MPTNEKAIKKVIQEEGGQLIEWIRTKGHQKIMIKIWGVVRTLSVSSSPKNEGRVLNGIKNDIRRIKRQIKGEVPE